MLPERFFAFHVEIMNDCAPRAIDPRVGARARGPFPLLCRLLRSLEASSRRLRTAPGLSILEAHVTDAVPTLGGFRGQPILHPPRQVSLGSHNRMRAFAVQIRRLVFHR